MFSTQTVTTSPLTTELVTTPGRLPGRVVPRMVHAPVTRPVVSAQAPLVTYSRRLKSPSGHFNVTVAVPLRDIATLNRLTPGTSPLEAGTVCPGGVGTVCPGDAGTVCPGGTIGLGSCANESGFVGLFRGPQPMLVARIAAASTALMVCEATNISK